MSNRKLKIGIVGAGFVGQTAHLMNFTQIKNCEIVALAEYRPQLRQKLSERYRISHLYESHKELLQNSDVEAVVVITPRAYTGPTALDCLEAGKHVLTEKPMASTVEQGQKLLDAARENNLHYVVGHMKRYDEGVQIGKKIFDELVASQELGAVLFARAHCFMGNSFANIDGYIKTDEEVNYPDVGWPVAPGWIPKELVGNYAGFINTFSHNTNLLRYFFNKTPKAQFARFDFPQGQVAMLDFGDFPASLEVGSVDTYTWDETTDIYFARGHLNVRTFPSFLRNIPGEVTLIKGGDKHEVYSPKADWTWAFKRQAEAFVDDILNNRKSISSGEDTIGDLVLMEDMWRKDLERRNRNLIDTESSLQKV